MNEAQASDGDWCNQQWWVVTEQQETGRGRDFTSLLDNWRKLEKRCKGTGIYEIRYATILLMLDQYDDAEQLLVSTPIPDSYQAQAETLQLAATLYKALSNAQPDVKEISRVRDRAASLIKQFPNEEGLYSMLGHTLVLLEEYDAAIEPLERVIESQRVDLSGPYRNLTVAYSRTGRYESALGAADTAYEFDKAVTSDEEFMFAAANAYAATGNLKAAKTMLTLILNKKPHLQNDPRFAKAVWEAKRLSGGKLQ